MRRRCLAMLLLGSACGAPQERAPMRGGAFAGLPAALAGVSLLAQARRSLATGQLDPELRRRILVSDDPALARARRVLAGLDAGPTAEASAEAPAVLPIVAPRLESMPQAGPVAPRSASPSPKAAAGQPVTVPERETADAPPTSSAGSTPAAAPRRVAHLHDVGLRSTRRGAALRLSASGGLLVGVANQRETGIVHLVVDADAVGSVLRRRPRVDGASVTSVREVGGSTFITLALDPGWRLGSIAKTSRGAEVALERVAAAG